MPIVNKKREPFERKRFPFRMTDPEQYKIKLLVQPHWHEHLEFIKIMEDSVQVTINNHKFEATKGDIVFFNSGQVHSVLSLSNRKNGIIKGMVFDKFFITNMMEGFDTKHLLDLYLDANKIQNHYQPSHPLWKGLNDCFETTEHEQATQDFCFEMAIKSCIYRMITSIFRHYKHINESASHDKTPVNSYLTTIKPVLDYVEEHIHEQIYVSQLYNLVSMSPHYFGKYFKKVTGTTITHYITASRINVAKRLLTDPQISVTEIAHQTGFCTIQYFNKVFKETTGVNPLQFRFKVTHSER